MLKLTVSIQRTFFTTKWMNTECYCGCCGCCLSLSTFHLDFISITVTRSRNAPSTLHPPLSQPHSARRPVNFGFPSPLIGFVGAEPPDEDTETTAILADTSVASDGFAALRCQANWHRLAGSPPPVLSLFSLLHACLSSSLLLLAASPAARWLLFWEREVELPVEICSRRRLAV